MLNGKNSTSPGLKRHRYRRRVFGDHSGERVHFVVQMTHVLHAVQIRERVEGVHVAAADLLGGYTVRWFDPGTTQRQPFSSSACSSAIHAPTSVSGCVLI